MGFNKLPIFQFSDTSLMQLQTRWGAIINSALDTVGLFNAQTPTQQAFNSGSGIYKTPSNVFYLNVKMGAQTGATTFGPSYLTATSTGVVVPNATNIDAFYFRQNNYLDVNISSPNSTYPYSIATNGYILVREFYQ